MYALTLIVSALGFVAATPSRGFEVRQAPTVASVDRYAGSGCTGTICNIAGSGDLHAGCNAITDQCQASLKLNYKNANCKGEFPHRSSISFTIWRDSLCKDTAQFANITSFDCYALGPPIKGISVDC
ncbi:Nn.00g013880.m01.CDS01 [Neocucurbitaria sp. VM-36]